MPEQTTTYDQMGGAPFFTMLVRRFYEGVAEDPALRPMYPEHVWRGARTPAAAPEARAVRRG